MSSNRNMSTEQIKRGLQNIKKAQLQVLKQLRADSFLPSQNTLLFTPISIKNLTSLEINQKASRQENNENFESRLEAGKNSTNFRKQQKRYLNKQTDANNNQRSIMTNESSSISGSAYEALRKQMTAEREQLNSKLIEISNKLNFIEKESAQVKSQARTEDSELNFQIRKLQEQNSRLRQNLRLKSQKLDQSENTQNQLKGQLELREKSIAIVQAQVRSLRLQNSKLSRAVRQMQGQLREQRNIIRELKQEKQLIKSQQNRLNMNLVIKEVKSISSSHEFLFNKLKESTQIDISWVEKESEIQNCFSRLLEYFQTISSSSSSSNYLTINEDNINVVAGVYSVRNGHDIRRLQPNNQLNQIIKKSMISESRAEQQSEFQYLVRQMGQNNLRKQLQELGEQNERLRRKITQLTIELGSYQIEKGKEGQNKYGTESNRLISLQLEEMREEVIKFRRFKGQMREEREQQEKEIMKYKLKARQLEGRVESTDRKLVQATNGRFAAQKKAQQQSIEIASLNSIIKEMNGKLNPSGQNQSPLREEFSKLLLTNSLLQREKQSLSAMNDGLQAQIQNFKYEKQQFEANNTQKHQLIEREIRQKNHLLQQIQKNQLKHNQLQEEIDKTKTALALNQQHTAKQRNSLEDLLQQKNDEVLQLRKELEQLYKQSREHHQLRFSFDRLQKEFKQLSRKSLKMGETLTHLWSVKQAQYFNINQILGILKISENGTGEGQS